MNIARSSTDVLCAQFCQNNHRECRALSQNQAHVRAHCGAQTDATMKISMCARVMIFFQPLLLVNFVFDRNEAYTAKSCLRCTRKSVSEFNLRYLNSIPKRVTAGDAHPSPCALPTLASDHNPPPISQAWLSWPTLLRGGTRHCPPWHYPIGPSRRGFDPLRLAAAGRGAALRAVGS